MRRRALIAGGALGAAALTLGLGWWRMDGPGPQARASADPGAGPLLPLPLGEQGWTLTDHRGATVRPRDWVGRPTMAFLGFTACPDVCPTTLSDISLWLEELGPEGNRLNVALISVDPARDTPAVLAEYLGYFDPRIVGLTGAPEEVERALADFSAEAERVPDQDGGYTMNHTAGVFLFDAGGIFANVIDFHEDRAYAVPKIRRLLG